MSHKRDSSVIGTRFVVKLVGNDGKQIIEHVNLKLSNTDLMEVDANGNEIGYSVPFENLGKIKLELKTPRGEQTKWKTFLVRHSYYKLTKDGVIQADAERNEIGHLIRWNRIRKFTVEVRAVVVPENGGDVEKGGSSRYRSHRRQRTPEILEDESIDLRESGDSHWEDSVVRFSDSMTDNNRNEQSGMFRSMMGAHEQRGFWMTFTVKDRIKRTKILKKILYRITLVNEWLYYNPGGKNKMSGKTIWLAEPAENGVNMKMKRKDDVQQSSREEELKFTKVMDLESYPFPFLIPLPRKGRFSEEAGKEKEMNIRKRRQDDRASASLDATWDTDCEWSNSNMGRDDDEMEKKPNKKKKKNKKGRAYDPIYPW